MNTTLPFFRLPQELREQVYSYLFDKDEPYIQSLTHSYNWDTLLPPPDCTGALRLWIEDEYLVTQRTWHNRRLADPVHDRAAVLRTCRKVYEDASEYLYGKTMFMMFNSQKYERRFNHCDRTLTWAEEEQMVASLVSHDTMKSFPYDEYPYSAIPGAKFWRFGEVPSTLWTAPRCELMGTISSCTFLRQVKHLRISIWAKKPADLGKMIAMLQKLCAVLPGSMRTLEVDLQFTEPRQRSIRPEVNELEFQQLVAVMTRIKALCLKPAKVSIHVDSPWWIAAFRKKRMLTLGGMSQSIYPKPEHVFDWYGKMCERWKIPYCDSWECERCSKWRIASVRGEESR